jgi:hypothetical protein
MFYWIDDPNITYLQCESVVRDGIRVPERQDLQKATIEKLKIANIKNSIIV